MSKVKRVRIDVYGRFEADVIRQKGSWVAYRRGIDGKRSLLRDLAIADDATTEEVVHVFDAAFHELADADAELRVIDILMA
jgi:hypothetical protein